MRERLDSIAAAHERLRTAAQTFDDEELRKATELPGWSRGHVLAHLGVLAVAFARQAEHARRGAIIAMYDGGRPARAAAIERGAGLPAPEVRTALERGFAALEDSWASLSALDWDRPVAYRDSTLVATQLCWWREVEIHSVDLDFGYRAQDWAPDLSAHVVDHLLPRLPSADAVRLMALDTGRHWGSDSGLKSGLKSGPGRAVEVRGRQHALAAWLAGRETTDPPTANGALPELGPWP